MFSFRIYRENQSREFLFGVENTNNNELISIINKVIKNRNCFKECVHLDDKVLLSFKNYNSLKFFLFGLCDFTLDDVYELERLGFKLQKLDLAVYGTGLSKMYTSYYSDEVDEVEEITFSELFLSDKDTSYKSIKDVYVPEDEMKYYKNKYGKFAKKFIV